MVERTGLGSLCLSKSGGARNYVGEVELVKKSSKAIDLESLPSILGVCPMVEQTVLGSLCLSKVEES